MRSISSCIRSRLGFSKREWGKLASTASTAAMRCSASRSAPRLGVGFCLGAVELAHTQRRWLEGAKSQVGKIDTGVVEPAHRHPLFAHHVGILPRFDRHIGQFSEHNGAIDQLFLLVAQQEQGMFKSAVVKLQGIVEDGEFRIHLKSPGFGPGFPPEHAARVRSFLALHEQLG